MNTKIRSRTAFPRMLEETLFKAYQEGKRSVDFLLLFYVTLSPFRSEGAKQINHPLCGCASKVIPS